MTKPTHGGTISDISQLSIPVDFAGRNSSDGCASAWYADGRGFDPHVRQHSFVEVCHEINLNFYGHSLPSADSRRAVVSHWRKNVH